MFLRTSSVPQSNQGPLGPSNQGQMLHSKVSVPHPYLNPIQAHCKSIQPKPKCFTRWSGCVPNGAAQGRYVLTKAKASSPTHPLLLAGSTLQTKWPPSVHTFAFSGFEGAQTAPALQTKYAPIGPESCWGSAVSDACPRRAVTCRLRIRSKAKASNPTHPLLLAGS